MALAEPTPSEIPEWTLGERLRKAREHAGMNRQEMAERLRVSIKDVWNWEHGTRPRKMHLEQLCQRWSEATGVPAPWILGISIRWNLESPPRALRLLPAGGAP